MQNRGEVEMVLLDASSIYDLDGTGLQALQEVIEAVRKAGHTFYISGALGPVRDRLFRAGLSEVIGEKNQFLNIHQAVECYRADDGSELWRQAALQNNEGPEKDK